MLPCVALLFPPSDRAPKAPEATAVGRALLALSDRVDVIVGATPDGGRAVGHRARPGRWEPARARPVAVIDRFPSFGRPRDYQSLLHGFGAPVFNPPEVTALLRDKVRTQWALADLGMPDATADPRRFGAFLERGPAFAKPRWGSFGHGVVWVDRPPTSRQTIDGVDQPVLLQRAVLPPQGFSGVALRILAQRTPDGWIARTPVARFRRGGGHAVVNRASGADVAPAEDLFGTATADRARALALRVARRFPGAIELGVDAVLDSDRVPHLIEVNGRPRGRLAALATQDPQRFGAEHHTALCAPFLAVPTG